jgi:hypothetical protein
MEGLAKWAISLGLVALCADGISGSACPMHLAAVQKSFSTADQNLSRLLVRFSDKYVRDLVSQ